MKYLMCLAGFAAVAAIDMPSLIKSKQRSELLKYVIVFILVFAFAILVTMDGNSTSTIKIIQSFYRDVLHLSFEKT